MSRPLAALFLLLITAGAPAAQGCGGGYLVVRGDTLYSIARRCGSSVAAIARASGLADPARIEIGQRLVIPGRRAGPPTASAGYTIAPGDTLYSLARWARVGLPALLAANPGIDPRKIEIGDEIRLPAGAADPVPARLRERGSPTPPPAAAPPPPEDEDEADKPDEESEPEPEGM